MGNYLYSDFEDCGFFYAKTKKIRHIYQYVYDIDNICRSVTKSQKRKARNRAVVKFNKNYYDNVNDLYWMLREERYVPGKYRKRKIYEPKERVLSIAPYYPDRIVDHCVINVLEPIWTSVFIPQTFSCIKGRGIHGCMEYISNALMNDKYGTKYALKIDIRKYYDTIDHDVLKKIVRYKIADPKVLRLLDTIIDSNGSNKGLPIGRYTSQFFANLYLSYFDHWMKEVNKCRYYSRYKDDILVLSESKKFLSNVLDKMALYLGSELKVEIKHNWQIFPVDSRDIDYVGFRMSHYDVRMRKSILMRFYRKYKRKKDHYSLKEECDVKHAYPSEYGWLTSCSESHKNVIIKKLVSNGNENC